MSDTVKTNSLLEEIQNELDAKYIEYAKKEFNLKLEHFNKIKPLCEKRDEFIKQNPDVLFDFWEKAFQNYDFGQELLPSDLENKYDSKWIKSLK
ncbi:belongs to the nap set family, partial [Vairimorpha apis BRL 01]